MNTKQIIGLITVSIFIIFLLLFYIVPNQKYETLNLNETKNEVKKELEKTESYYQSTSEWMDAAEKAEDIGYLNPGHKGGENTSFYKDLVNYFVVGLLEKDTNIFLSTFAPETISRDVFKSSETDKEKVVQQMISKISRQDTIQNIRYAENKGAFNKSTDKITLKLSYSDGKRAKCTISVIKGGDKHRTQSYYLITTSIWSIIEQIEESLK